MLRRVPFRQKRVRSVIPGYPSREIFEAKRLYQVAHAKGQPHLYHPQAAWSAQWPPSCPLSTLKSRSSPRAQSAFERRGKRMAFIDSTFGAALIGLIVSAW